MFRIWVTTGPTSWYPTGRMGHDELARNLRAIKLTSHEYIIYEG